MEISNKDILGAVADDLLHLIIFPTEACNFRCIYCYETFQQGAMAPETVASIKQLLRLRAGSLKYINISWFGGEPLLALDAIRGISREAVDLAKLNKNIVYYADMTTNGFLLSPPTFQGLVELGVRRFQISLDGTREIHDSRRVLVNGKGTFTRIWDNLESCKGAKNGFTIMVRVHLAKDNYSEVVELIKLYANTFGDDNRFKLFLRPLSRLGCTRDADLPVLEDKNGDLMVGDMVKRARQLGVEPVTTDDLVPVCYAARLNSFAIRSDGTINKCTVKLGHTENQVGRIDANGSLNLDRQRLMKWARGLKSGDPEELACPLIGL